MSIDAFLERIVVALEAIATALANTAVTTAAPGVVVPAAPAQPAQPASFAGEQPAPAAATMNNEPPNAKNATAK